MRWFFCGVDMWSNNGTFISCVYGCVWFCFEFFYLYFILNNVSNQNSKKKFEQKCYPVNQNYSIGLKLFVTNSKYIFVIITLFQGLENLPLRPIIPNSLQKVSDVALVAVVRIDLAYSPLSVHLVHLSKPTWSTKESIRPTEGQSGMSLALVCQYMNKGFGSGSTTNIRQYIHLIK